MTVPVQLLVSLAGGPYLGSTTQQGLAGQTLDMKAANSSLFSVASYEIYDYPPGFSTPGGWTKDPGSGIIYFRPSNPTTQPPTVTLPSLSSTTWGKFPLRLRGNNNPNQFNADRSPNTAFSFALTDETSLIWIASPNTGMEGLGYYESTQRDAMRGFVAPIMSSLRALDAALPTTGTATTQTVSATPVVAASLAQPDNTVTDWTVTIIGRNNANNGDLYRANYAFTGQRATSFNSDNLAILPGSPTASNVRTNGGGSGYATSITVSGNSVVVTVTGVAATTVNWTVSYQFLSRI